MSMRRRLSKNSVARGDRVVLPPSPADENPYLVEVVVELGKSGYHYKRLVEQQQHLVPARRPRAARPGQQDRVPARRLAPRQVCAVTRPPARPGSGAARSAAPTGPACPRPCRSRPASFLIAEYLRL